MKSHRCRTALVILLAATTAPAMFMRPEKLPIDRLIKNTETFLAAHPDDAGAHYTLGRIHYLAFVNKSAEIDAFNAGTDARAPSLAPNWMLGNALEGSRRAEAERRTLAEMGLKDKSELKREDYAKFHPRVAAINDELRAGDWSPPALPADELAGHATAALRSFEKSVALDPANSLHRLGLASLMEQARAAGVEGLPGKLANVSEAGLIDEYTAAFKLGQAEDAKLVHRPVAGINSLASHEAGRAALRLIEAAPADIKAARAKDKAEIEAHLKKLEKLPVGAITPILTCTAPGRSLASLLRPGTTVRFDLDGDGTVEHWPWIAPEAGLLVWDPDRRGVVHSGRQLFGSYTFRLFWRDGYAALAALDDNADRALRGRELEGIRIWFDRDSDGVSDPGEVEDLAAHGVTGLAVGSVDSVARRPAESPRPGTARRHHPRHLGLDHHPQRRPSAPR